MMLTSTLEFWMPSTKQNTLQLCGCLAELPFWGFPPVHVYTEWMLHCQAVASWERGKAELCICSPTNCFFFCQQAFLFENGF